METLSTVSDNVVCNLTGSKQLLCLSAYFPSPIMTLELACLRESITAVHVLALPDGRWENIDGWRN